MFSGSPTRFARIFVFTIVGFALVACSKPQTPEEVAENFWQAIESGKPNNVKKHVSAKDQITMESLQNVMPISDISFGKIVIDGNIASVDTNVTLQGDQSMELPINTHLVKENERWAVDYERTIHTIIAAGKVAAVINQFKDIGNAVKEGIGRSVVELEKTLPAIEKELSNMEQQIQQAVPELKSRFENFSRQLEQALAAPLENTDPNSDAPKLPAPKLDNQDSATEDMDMPSNEGSAETDTAQNAMPQLTEELANIEEEILKAVPQLKEQIHGFVEQLQEALALPPTEQSEQSAETAKQIEI